MKICSKCRRSLPIDNFNKKKSGRQALCRECQSEYSKAHYHTNTKQYLERNQKTKKRLRKLLCELKAVPCTDCEIKYPSHVMHFDHLPGHEKEFSLAHAAVMGSERRLRDEAAKCEVVCANCHAERTHRRRSKSVL